MPKHALESAKETPSKRSRSEMGAPLLPVRPCDSPTNPFGRQRVRNLVNSLPPSSLFSKHLPLRFQLVRTDRPSPRLFGGVHRIVQVPANYTFMHLRCLITFLFGGSRSALLLGEPHLFEVKRKIQLFSMLFKPGQVKSGQTWAKLSSAKDPCRYRPECNMTNDAEFPKYQDAEEEEPGEWKWHAEEDFALDRAWPKGCELTRAVIYHHDHTTQVHITINTLAMPKRKGASNTPYIFSGRGLVTLSPAPIPRLVFESPAHSQTSEEDSVDQDAECEYDSDECDAFWDPAVWDPAADDSDASHQAHDTDNIRAEIDPDDYNDANAFPLFFSRCHRLSRSRLQSGTSFGQEYDLSSASEGEQDSGEEPTTPSTYMASSSPPKRADDYSSPATSLFGSSVPRSRHLSKGREMASPPPQTSSPRPSSPVSSPASNKASSSRRTHLHVLSSPGNFFEPRTNRPLSRRRHSSLLHNLPFHPSPSGFPKYTPLPARGKLYRMRINRIEKRVERMKSLEWLKVADEEDENEKKKKREEEEKARDKDREEKEMFKRRLLDRRAPGGVLEMGIRRGKRPPVTFPDAQMPKLNRVSSRWHPYDDEFEV